MRVRGLGCAGRLTVVVHRASVRDGEEPAAEVVGAAKPGVCRERLGPRLLCDVLRGSWAREGVGKPTDVAPVGIDEVLEGRQAHGG